MPRAGKQEEVAPGERACHQHSIGWRRRRVVLAGQDQGGNGAGDGLLLHRGHRLDVPELTHGVILLGCRKKEMSALWFHHLNGCLKGLWGEAILAAVDRELHTPHAF